MLEVDQHGFDEIDRKLLLTIIEKYQGGPVGVNTLAAALAEEADAIEEIYEPFLIQIGFLTARLGARRHAARLRAFWHFPQSPPDFPFLVIPAYAVSARTSEGPHSAKSIGNNAAMVYRASSIVGRAVSGRIL